MLCPFVCATLASYTKDCNYMDDMDYMESMEYMEYMDLWLTWTPWTKWTTWIKRSKKFTEVAAPGDSRVD